MANYILCLIIFRIALPILIGTCVAFRPCGLSAIYLLFMFYLPLVPVPTPKTLNSYTGNYLKILILVSVLTTLTQLSFQLYLVIEAPYGHFLKDCTQLEKILRHVGLVRLNAASAITVITWISPELLMLLFSTVIYSTLKHISGALYTDEVEEGLIQTKTRNKPSPIDGVLVFLGKYCVLATLCFAAVLRPSVIGGLYFLVFLTAATWWACYRPLGKGFAITLRSLMVIVLCHLSCVYAYQFPWLQEYLKRDNPYARYFGFVPVISVNCKEDPRVFLWSAEEWATYVHPLALYLLYYVVALESKILFRPQDESQTKATETTPLIRGISPANSRRYDATMGRSGESNSSAIFSGDDIQLDNIDMIMGGGGSSTLGMVNDVCIEDDDAYKATFCENVIFALEALLQVIIKSSYIGTNIIMMTWSITYLSWLTFVLLLWANLLWLVPKQRKSMLRSSPFLVMYAWFLLLSAYAYSMNLTEAELPSTVQGINLAQIGFQKSTILPCNALLIKCLFTTMFWITLRQYMQERANERQANALTDMVAPLHLSVEAATGGTFGGGVGTKQQQHPPGQQEVGSKLMHAIGKLLKNLATKCWIWVVAITLFAVAITGKRMTGFRIVYMGLFLFFILSFQLSFKMWRKMMFGFWLTVIVYSMINLVMVYTYQFDNFPEYWSYYLHVAVEQQLDIGMERFETKQLFVRLVTPTSFVIITVIQLHYFHKDFMQLSDPKNTNIIDVDVDESSLQGGVLHPIPTPNTISTAGPSPSSTHVDSDTKEAGATSTDSTRFDVSDIGNVSSVYIKKIWLINVRHAMNLSFLFLELHMPKIVLLFAMLACVYDTCALYILVVVLIVLALTCGRPMRIFCIYMSSVYMSGVLLARMIYQIQYIEPGQWNVTCDKGAESITVNNAQWLGFYKDEDLGYLVVWNVIYLIIVTLWSVILVRQFYYRLSRNRPTTRIFFMFPKITRLEADRNLRNCIKYFFNYGFYKFGVELCLIATVGLIGIRMDMYSTFYAIWLCVMFNMSRQKLAKLWPIYMAFIAFLIPIQYFMAVGLPPSLCILFPWDRDYWSTATDRAELYRRFQEWAFLLDSEYSPSPRKLICDFVLLLFVSRQSVVFRIERRYEHSSGQEYTGGSNNCIYHLAENLNFINPVPDFVTYVRSYLDVMKRAILLSFLWVTLAIVFLAGTNRVNIFSIGYLVGAFVFLWQGTDLYLRPIPNILQSWNWLMGYNVFVILTKTVLQIVGCIYLQDIPKYSCWAIQLFGIGCVRKFANVTKAAGLEDPDSIACTVPREFVGLVWDGLSFAFLILQRRIFQSYNFFHMIDEAKASTILASRGAELIEELRQKQMNQQEEQEHKVLEKIKMKMDRIKANQQRIQGATFKDVTNHYVDTIFSSRPKHRRCPPDNYKSAVRSGDYYMFDDMDDEDIDLIDADQPEEEDVDTLVMPKQYTVGKLIKQALKTDIVTTIRHVSRSEADIKRRLSMPLTRQKSSMSTRSQPEPSSLPISALTTSDEAHQASKNVTIIDDTLDGRFDSARSSYHRPPDGSDPDQGPTTSQMHDELSDISDYREFGCWQKILNYLMFTWDFIKSLMLSATIFLNSHSKDYRYVVRVLSKEKKILKENTTYNIGLRLGTGQVWQPAASYHTLLKQTNEQETNTLDDYDATEMSSYDQPIIIRLMLAIWFIILSRSEMLCYFIVFLNQIKSATFLSLPLPLMVFFWGTLTVPRPAKTFWVTIIAYTELIVLIKCMFQFDIIPWNMNQRIINSPFYPPKIIGIERSKNYAVWDLLLLLVVFFHRFMLKSLGLWRTSVIPAVMLTDGDYRIDSQNQLVPVSAHITSKGSTESITQGAHDDKDGGTRSQNQCSNFSSGDDNQNRIVTVHTDTVDPMDHIPAALQMATSKHLESLKRFFRQLLDPTSRLADDVYSFMFMCDFVNFLVILVGYSSFGSQAGDVGVSSYLEDNRVPGAFLVMLILQFMIIIVDRAIFLRKNILAKVVFQYLQIVLLHFCLFILFPLVTEKNFNSVVPPQMYYIVKCFYLLLSAYQIRCGYPTRILGNFLCKGYNYVNMFLFKGFMMVPFLFEMRTVMDWMWTDTSMTVFDWIKMEDIFAHIFQLKCSRQVESEYPQPRGTKKQPMVKYLMGGGILVLIIGVIWFPLVFFSLGNAVGQPNPPYDVTVELRIGPYEPIYQMSAQSNSINSFSENDMAKMLQVYSQNRMAVTFISNYEASDVAAVKLSSNSANVWSISPPDRIRMLAEVSSADPFTVRLEYHVSHKTSKSEDSGIIVDHVPIVVAPNDEMRANLLKMLQSNESTSPVVLSSIFPKFLKVTSKGTAKPVSQLMVDVEDSISDATAGGLPTNPLIGDDDGLVNDNMVQYSKTTAYRDIILMLNHLGNQEWWQIHENCTNYNYKKYLKNLPYADCDSVMMYTFNDKVFPSTLNIITGGGIIGLYTTLVFVASRVLRGFFAEQCFKIMFEDLPNVDRVLQLCLDIYLVREAREFALEEDLFAKLVFLFRSPETMIKWTRPKEELTGGNGDADDDDDDEMENGELASIDGNERRRRMLHLEDDSIRT